MKIAIDARLFGPQGTGIGKYTEKLIENLQKIDKRNNYFIILRKDNWYLFTPTSPNFEKVMVDAPFYSLKEQALLPAALQKIKPDVVHFTNFNVPLLYSGKFVVTIHDIITKEFSGFSTTTRSLPVYLLKRAGLEITLRQTIRKAAKIIVPSFFVKRKLTEDFRAAKNKIDVVNEGVDRSLVTTGKENISLGRQKQILLKYGIKSPFILYVGSYYPHKNIETLLAAFKFVDEKYQLLLVGDRNIFLERILKIARLLKVEDRVLVSGFVADDELPTLYKEASCFVFPSISEGFGLPGLESMASGCPVVASDILTFKEIYGEGALYFNPKKPEDLTSKINNLVKNQKMRAKLIETGFEQIKKYSWEKMARETMEIYRSVGSKA